MNHLGNLGHWWIGRRIYFLVWYLFHEEFGLKSSVDKTNSGRWLIKRGGQANPHK